MSGQYSKRQITNSSESHAHHIIIGRFVNAIATEVLLVWEAHYVLWRLTHDKGHHAGHVLGSVGLL